MTSISEENNVERRSAVLHFYDYVDRAGLPEEFKRAMKEAVIVRVEISSAERKWRVQLLLDRLVQRCHLNALADLVAADIAGLQKIEFIVRYNLPDITLEDIARDYWDEMCNFIISSHPMLSGWLPGSVKQVHGNTLQIFVKGQIAADIMNHRNIAGALSAYLSEQFDREIKVTISAIEDDQCDRVVNDQEEQFVKALLQQKREVSESSGDQPPENKPKPYGQGGGKEFRRRRSTEPEPGSLKGKVITGQAVTIDQVVEEEKSVIVQGRILKLEVRLLKSGRNLVSFDLTDLTDSITVKFFEDEKEEGRVSGALHKGMWVKVRGPVQQDTFVRELVLMAYDINVAEFETRQDTAEEKRVELHLHTKMSSMDGVAGVGDVVGRAAKWGHPAVAITDHGVVQAFPDAYEAGKKHGIKIIYGMEGYLVDDGAPIVIGPQSRAIADEEFVVFDIETTGFSAAADDIIEIGAVKLRGGQVTGRYSTFVRPRRPIPAEVQKLTGIIPEMVAEARFIEEVLPEFMDFAGNAALVAHNAQFDTGFIRANLRRHFSRALENTVLDTLSLARALMPQLKNHKLKNLAKEYGIPLENHHRAVDDAEATAGIFLKLLQALTERGITKLDEINQLAKEINVDKLKTYHIILLVENYTGLRNLYRLVTDSHLKYFYRQPRLPKSELIKRRDGLIIGSACEAGELFNALLDGAEEEKLEQIVSFYDYLEIQPRSNNQFLVRDGRVQGQEGLEELNRTIVELGARFNKPVVATTDAHFIEPHDGIYRQLLMAGKGFDDVDQQAPLYFRTTEEMLEEFSYLGQELAKEVVIRNPQMIAGRVEEIKPMPDDFFPPKIDGAEEQISSMTRNRAVEIYGDPLPEVVRLRVEKELNSIITNGFAVLYLIAHKLVKKSNEDGYLVGSRGSVGSSFVATMTGITEVNPLPPHYVCPECKHSEFIEDGSYGCGADLPDKDCPKCGTRFRKDGFDIPFEVFLGFEGDKVPDIDLNFSGDYQPRAHKFTEELFGEGYVFRAGTIGTIAEKTAFGFVQKYMEERGLRRRRAELDRLVSGCTGVKRTTGQHPGGVMVIPRDMDVHDFTPLQYPADDKKSGVITTHFDYHSISGRIVKLDILGHDDPTVIKMLEDLTGVNAKTIPLDEPRTMRIFSDTEPLGVTPEQIRSKMGSYAIPEFGTKFVRQMLEDTKPTTFSELVRISGFSHGTDVWLNNAQDLIREGTCQLSEAISARDDIMIYLIYKGLQPKRAFKIMEGVRKGKGVKPEDEEYMRENNVPEWYIGSCKKIKYMFPKAHAVAYVMMAFRIAYFKVYYPEAFYATYFTVRADEFDADIIVQGSDSVREKIEDIENRMKGDGKKDVTTKEKNLLTILEVALEMFERGIKMRRVSLEESEATKFLITENGLLPPFASLQGLGGTAAQNIVEARQEKAFSSIEDLRTRARLSKTVIDILQNHGCLRDMPETDQMQLF